MEKNLLRAIQIGTASGKVVAPEYSKDYIEILRDLKPFWGELSTTKFCFLEDLKNGGASGLGKLVVEEALSEAKRLKRLMLVLGYSKFVVSDPELWPANAKFLGIRDKHMLAGKAGYEKARKELQTLKPGKSHFEVCQQRLKDYYLGTGWFRETPLRWVLIEKL